MKNENQTPEQQPENHAGIYQALANFQYDCPTIPKMKKGYGYNYAELSKTVELIKPHLKKHQLGYTQLLEGENELTTVVFHYPTKEEITSKVTMPKGLILKDMNEYQTDGARNTYYKRYVLLGILGVMTEDEDIDAGGRTTKQKTDQPEKPAKPKLNNNHFMQLLGAIKTGDTTVEKALEFYDLNEQQRATLQSGEI